MPELSHDFEHAAVKALGNQQLRTNFRRVMTGLMNKRAAQFPDPDELQALRSRGKSIKDRALAKLPDLLVQLEQNLIANGIQVHWAESVDEGNRIILDILRKANAKSLIKGKSMVSEEMHFNHFLEENNIRALESDLGEYIIQLAGEGPSHIVMPAIHKNKGEIGKLFQEKIDGQGYTDDPDELTAAARRVLRQMFANADAGFSGVNFAAADTGSLVLMSNEGNGRMSTHLPSMHIALMGIEKVIERLEDVGPLISLACRSATGQPITTYVNVISGPRKAGEKDGPKEVHLVILDNGRTRIYDDPQLREGLRCIRCAACMNHCPVYTRIGGHAYQYTYPGPIGEILNPQMQGIEKAGDVLHASSLCGRCAEVCPVKIPLVDLIVRLRRESIRPSADAVKGGGSRKSGMENVIWFGWKTMYANPLFYRWGTWWLRKIGNLMPAGLPLLKQWTSVRSKPQFASRSIYDLARERGIRDE
ncbi:LutB/LldF family L-lactate oxidation iron-sulfur protein [Telmatospirillum siberiense]|uniref:Iron-sulfur cluster-binding protein n=1 Tax=Telmatospirillum siberiense TaxID=382514 RepID=A0A2N3PZT1_9PROT|nr:LutB/LldF family L-lactate oxidation iron-sulfur protein [Telmatospirillum siberiense]PKU25899.1 iron-sulfur cluster-binding protein [Telmatospirillum siberiense]